MNKLNAEGKYHGYHEVLWDNGVVRSKGNYDNGYRVGEWEYFYHNGVLALKGNFIADKRVGCWLEYDFYGELQDDKLFGRVEYYL